MKVYVKGPYNDVTKIEFCCGDLSCDILLGKITARKWTDHPLNFYINDYNDDGFRINNCPHCGAKIEKKFDL